MRPLSETVLEPGQDFRDSSAILFPVEALYWEELMPSHRGGNWGVETVNPLSGWPSLCPGCLLISKPNSR